MFRGENNIGQKFLMTLINQIGMRSGNINKYSFVYERLKGKMNVCNK